MFRFRLAKWLAMARDSAGHKEETGRQYQPPQARHAAQHTAPQCHSQPSKPAESLDNEALRYLLHAIFGMFKHQTAFDGNKVFALPTPDISTTEAAA